MFYHLPLPQILRLFIHDFKLFQNVSISMRKSLICAGKNTQGLRRLKTKWGRQRNNYMLLSMEKDLEQISIKHCVVVLKKSQRSVHFLISLPEANQTSRTKSIFTHSRIRLVPAEGRPWSFPIRKFAVFIGKRQFMHPLIYYFGKENWIGISGYCLDLCRPGISTLRKIERKLH